MKTDFPTYSKIQVVNLIAAAESQYELSLLWYRISPEKDKYCLADIHEVIDSLNAQYFYLEALKIIRQK
jgi:hypothetical protein